MDPLVLYTICSAYNLPFPDDYLKMIKIPTNTFGFFITVHRSQPLLKWPHDIHGCIGYWEDKKMSKAAIIRKIPGIAHSSFFTDSRVQYYVIPLLEDPNSKIEISFMRLPLTPISANRKTFDNEKYGLIVDSNQGRATYLPNVFQTKDWKEISASLLKKASIKTGTFYQYQTSVVKGKLRTVFEREYLDWIIQEYLIFMEVNYYDFVPYMVENGKVITDKTENVRNCATLCELLELPVSKNLEAKIRRDIKYYLGKWKNNNMEQANAFLILGLAKIRSHVKSWSPILDDICDDLYKKLDTMEPQFQLGETLIALYQICPIIKEITYWQKWMQKRLERLDGDIQNIFEYNWQAKFLFAIRKDIPAKEHAKELLRRLIGMKITADMETNYLAVYFEATMSLWGILGDNEIFSIILPVWVYLLQRWKNGLFSLKNGTTSATSTARIDITGHVINGIQVILLNI